jgi:hypothetical protein
VVHGPGLPAGHDRRLGALEPGAGARRHAQRGAPPREAQRELAVRSGSGAAGARLLAAGARLLAAGACAEQTTDGPGLLTAPCAAGPPTSLQLSCQATQAQCTNGKKVALVVDLPGLNAAPQAASPGTNGTSAAKCSKLALAACQAVRGARRGAAERGGARRSAPSHPPRRPPAGLGAAPQAPPAPKPPALLGACRHGPQPLPPPRPHPSPLPRRPACAVPRCQVVEDPVKSPCAAFLKTGSATCSAARFQSIYKAHAASVCGGVASAAVDARAAKATPAAPAANASAAANTTAAPRNTSAAAPAPAAAPVLPRAPLQPAVNATPCVACVTCKVCTRRAPLGPLREALTFSVGCGTPSKRHQRHPLRP